MDGDYSFSPRFIDGITTVEVVNSDDYDEPLTLSMSWNWRGQLKDTYTNGLRDAQIHWTADYDNLGVLLYLGDTPDNMSIGHKGVRYKNVGSYNGDIIDLEIIPTDINGYTYGEIEEINNNNSLYTGVPLYTAPLFAYFTDRIGFYLVDTALHTDLLGNNMYYSDYTFTFYYDGTDELADIKYKVGIDDIDWCQFIEVGNSTDVNIVLSCDTMLEQTTVYDNTRIYDASNADIQNYEIEYAVILTETTTNPITIRFGQPKDNINDRNASAFMLSDIAIAPYNSPSLYKEMFVNN